MEYKNLGIIFKYNRNERKMTLEEVEAKTGIYKNKINHFECGRSEFSKKEMKQLYHALNIVYCEEDLLDFTRKKLNKIYEAASFLEDVTPFYEQLKEVKPRLQSTEAYPLYLLGELIVQYTQGQRNKMLSRFRTLLMFKDFFSEEQLYMLYDMKGLYYTNERKYEQALQCFDKIEIRNAGAVVKAMVYHHKIYPLKGLGRLSEGIEYSAKAKTMFECQLNLKRSILSSCQLASLYTCFGRFEESENKYLQCISALKSYPVGNELSRVYCELLWNAILSKSYDKVILLQEEALAGSDHKAFIYFFLSYAWNQKGESQKAKYWIKEAKLHMEKEIRLIKGLIDALHTLLLSKSDELKERKLEQLRNIAYNNNEFMATIFVLQMICEYYQKKEDTKKIIALKDEIISLYQRRN